MQKAQINTNNQQHHFFPAPCSLDVFCNGTLLWPCCDGCWFFMTLSVSLLKISSMLLPSLADTSKKSMPQRSASSSPCLQETLRSSLRSLLEATSIMMISALPASLICSTHFSMCWQLLGSMTEQVSTMPWAPLQKDFVMLRNRSCPAVSQMLRVKGCPLCQMRLILKSTPMVLRQSVWKVSSQQRTSRLVLPTPLSPTTRYFRVMLFGFDISYVIIRCRAIFILFELVNTGLLCVVSEINRQTEIYYKTQIIAWLLKNLWFPIIFL